MIASTLSQTEVTPRPESAERADRLMKMATRYDLPLILLAALMMAVARYL